MVIKVMNTSLDNIEEELKAKSITEYCGAREFQSYRAISYKNKNVLDFIIKSMNTATSTISDPGRRQYMRDSVIEMIKNEIDLIPNEIHLPPTHYVFYRLVQSQIVLYELNTCILEHIGIITRHDPTAVVAAPYLNEDIYPKDLYDYMYWFSLGNTDVGGNFDDEDGEFKDFHLTLLCVNNCLHPIVNHKEFNRFLYGYNEEAEPLKYFGEGYEVSGGRSERAMVSSLTTAYNVSKSEAQVIVGELMTIYRKSTDKGHCMQIFIPNTLESLDKYTYLSTAYGHPVTVYRENDDSEKGFGYRMFDDISKRPSVIREQKEMQDMKDAHPLIPMREVLSTLHMSHLQARIIGHPNLFIKDGAFSKVISSDPNFTLQSLNIKSILQRLSPRDDKSWTHYKKFI